MVNLRLERAIGYIERDVRMFGLHQALEIIFMDSGHLACAVIINCPKQAFHKIGR